VLNDRNNFSFEDQYFKIDDFYLYVSGLPWPQTESLRLWEQAFSYNINEKYFLLKNK